MKLMRFIGIHLKKNEDFLTTFKPILIIYSFLYLNVNVFKMWIKILVVFFFTFPTELEKKPPSCIILDITLKNIYNIFYDMLRC